MNKHISGITLSAILLAASSAGASEFAGSYMGGKLGGNRSNFNGPAVVNGAGTNLTDMGSKDAAAFGLEGGRNWDMSSYLLGVDFFIDSNEKATHSVSKSGVAGTANFGSTVYGMDLKLGLPNGIWMPYAKLGYGRGKANGDLTAGGNGAHAGLGVEYKFSPHWSLVGELTTLAADSTGTRLNNNNFTIGVNYYFRAPKAAPVAVAEPVVAPKPEPKIEPKPEPKVVAPPPPAPAPAPQPKETWKTTLTEKLVRLEGANFASGSAKLLPSADAKLNEVVEAAKHYADVKLDVSGHTDNQGKKAYNQKLSEGRAASVKKYLVQKGVAEDRIVTSGHADTQPIADNNTKEGRAANRRVEVRYMQKEEKRVRVVE
ncbi:MAG: OmpA-OmpF porin OOP family [Gallionellaceae bacterium]|nr:MAG: OmpA-OmpF porin OOP family [Gallionellaceae bacterium]